MYCSKTCGTRWGTALLPTPALPASRWVRASEEILSPPAEAVAVPVPRTRTARCGHAVPTHGGRQRLWCADCLLIPRARTAGPKTQRACERCGQTFEVKHAGARYCSRRCSSRRYPPVCTTRGCNKPHRAKGLCNQCYKVCNYPDRPRFQFHDDPEAKRKRDLIRSKRRRAAVRGVRVEDVDRQKVGERDGWTCGICRRAVDPAVQYPDPDSQSLDHVVPLVEGGEHSYANARITHLRCNVLRQHRGGGEQLALL